MEKEHDEISSSETEHAKKERMDSALASLSERAYGSWLFRFPFYIAILSLAGAAVFSVTGAITIGNQTANLRAELDTAVKSTLDRLNDSAEQAERDVQALSDRAEAQVTQHREEMTEAFSKLAEDRRQFSETTLAERASILKMTQQAQQDVQADVARFTAQTEEMRDDAVSTIVDSISPEFADLNEMLKAKVSGVAADSENKIREFGEGELTSLQASGRDLRTRVEEIARVLNDAEPARIRLVEFTGRLGEFEDAIESARRRGGDLVGELERRNQEARGRLEDAAQIEIEAKAQTRRMEELAGGAEAAASQVDMLLANVPEAAAKLPAAWTQLGSVEGQLAMLANRSDAAASRVEAAESEAERLAGIVDPLSANVAGLEARLTTVTEMLARIEAELQTVEGNLPEPEADEPPAQSAPSQQRAEGDLTPSEWQVVQQSLAARGYQPGGADGIAGDRTRAAIRRFQVDRGAPTTGLLTPQEIEILLPSSP